MFVDMLRTTVAFISLSRSPKSHGVMSRSQRDLECDLEMTFNDFIKIEPSRLGYGGFIDMPITMALFIFLSRSPKGHGVTLK